MNGVAYPPDPDDESAFRAQTISTDARGVEVRSGEQLCFRADWGEIIEIDAWKTDIGPSEIFNLGFKRRGEDFYCKVNEWQQGWVELLAALELRFGLAVSEWWEKVALPVFQRNVTILWKANE